MICYFVVYSLNIALCVILYFFFFKQKTAYEMRISDWSSDVCSSDLGKSKVKGALIRPSGTFSREREKGLMRGGFGFARGVRGLGWVGRGLGEQLGEERGQGFGGGGVEGVGADAVEAGGEVAFVFAVAGGVDEAGIGSASGRGRRGK